MHHAIQSTRVLIEGTIRPATVVVKGKSIASIEAYGAAVNCPVEDVGNLVVMPGFIDAHVHINEPGRTHWEGYETASKAAAAGGVTTMVEMPLNSDPVRCNWPVIAAAQDIAAGKIYQSVAQWGGVIPSNLNDIEEMLKHGVPGIKAFLTHSGIDSFPNVTEADLRQVMPTMAKYNVPLLVHCELDSPHEATAALLQRPTSYAHYLASRPKAWENAAVRLMIRLCEETGCRVHIVHLSSAEMLPELREARQKGLPITVETCPHYLVFAAETIPDADTRYKCAPPIREAANNEQLWAALGDVIDFVASDHSPAPPDTKELESGNLAKAWGGIAGLQFTFPALWTGAHQRGISLEKVSQLLSTKPAEFIGLGNSKGSIKPGYDADFAVVEPDAKLTVSEASIFHRHKVTPYVDLQMRGVVHQTWWQGQKIFENGRLIGECRGTNPM